MMKFNITRPKKYTKNNEEKTLWLQVGVITKFDNGNMIMELNDREDVYQIFPMKPKTENPQTQQSSPAQQMQAGINNVTEEIKVDEIPF